MYVFAIADLHLPFLASRSIDRAKHPHTRHSITAHRPTNATEICSTRCQITVRWRPFLSVPSVIDRFLILLHFRCAFVNFKDRPTAERAAEAWANGLEVDGETVGVKWGRSRANAAAKMPAAPAAASTSALVGS